MCLFLLLIHSCVFPTFTLFLAQGKSGVSTSTEQSLAARFGRQGAQARFRGQMANGGSLLLGLGLRLTTYTHSWDLFLLFATGKSGGHLEGMGGCGCERDPVSVRQRWTNAHAAPPGICLASIGFGNGTGTSVAHHTCLTTTNFFCLYHDSRFLRTTRFSASSPSPRGQGHKPTDGWMDGRCADPRSGNCEPASHPAHPTPASHSKNGQDFVWRKRGL